MEKKVLGKGLEALIPKKADSLRELINLPISKLRPGKYQPRHLIADKELNELALSIKATGVLQPILVRKLADNNFEIVAGQRRFEAVKSLGLPSIPAIVKEIDDKETLTLAIIENLQRQDLNPIEEAEAFARLMEEFNFGLDDIARVVSKDKTTVSNTLRLLKLPDTIKNALRKGLISRSQARTILALTDPKSQEKLFNQILRNDLTVREIETRVRKKSAKHISKINDPHTREVEERLQKFLGTKVQLQNKNNKGTISISYYNLDDLDRLLAKLGI